MSLDELRQRHRAARRALDPTVQAEHAVDAATRARAEVPELGAVTRIGTYWPTDGELDPLPLTEALIRSGVQAFLPIVGTDGTLEFGRWQPGDPLVSDRFGIPAPDDPEPLPARLLDAVLVPVVAVDPEGIRVGRGQGFYDRALAPAGATTAPDRPLLIGVCHEQQVLREPVRPEPWDVPLDVLVTEARTRRWIRGPAEQADR